VSGVEGDPGSRQFLVHDTWSGRTGWVPEAALVDGTWAKAFLGESKTASFIDLMYLVDG
jgi:hypothetical protein